MKYELIYSSDFPEFYYEDSDVPVSEGNLVGVELDMNDTVELILFDDIYWDPSGGYEH